MSNLLSSLLLNRFMYNSFTEKASDMLQWPATALLLEKTLAWRNKDPNLKRKLMASAAFLGIAFLTAIEIVAKEIFGIIALIPPFTVIGITLIFTPIVFGTQVLFSSISLSIKTLFREKIEQFRLDLI